MHIFTLKTDRNRFESESPAQSIYLLIAAFGVKNAIKMDLVEVLVRRLVQVGIADRPGICEFASQMFKDDVDSYSVAKKDVLVALSSRRSLRNPGQKSTS